jgi:endonuclease YncB( thermonuclease family)
MRHIMAYTLKLVQVLILTIAICFLCAFKVHDGDSFTRDNGQKVRLFGIDSPEMPNGRCPEQTCLNKQGIKYRCAVEARDYLKHLIDGKKVTCKIKGRSYNRVVGDCYVNGMSISEEMVSSGWALREKKYSKERFRMAEITARLLKRGIWQGEFQDPAIYRWMCKKPTSTR